VFTIPVRRLLNLKPEIHYVYLDAAPAQDFPFDKIPGGRDYPWHTGVAEEVFYEVDGKVIWGLTARILQHFLALISNQG
ncbi:MAG TPA: coenzyme A pyrophosphatase, partial [bacterium]|nr:coenzyme A pyrophosphatase [bacterium]